MQPVIRLSVVDPRIALPGNLKATPWNGRQPSGLSWAKDGNRASHDGCHRHDHGLLAPNLHSPQEGRRVFRLESRIGNSSGAGRWIRGHVAADHPHRSEIDRAVLRPIEQPRRAADSDRPRPTW